MLTKEECSEAYEVIDTLIHLMCGETREDGYEPTMDETINSMRILKQLIDKHFEIIKEKERLEKALDKACEELESYDYRANLRPNCYAPDEYRCAEEWKEWSLNDVG